MTFKITLYHFLYSASTSNPFSLQIIVKHQECSAVKSFLHVQIGLIAFQLMTTASSTWKKRQQQCNFSQNNFERLEFYGK